MQFSCNWCQVDSEVDKNLIQNNVDNIRFICRECLIPIILDTGEDEESSEELFLPSNEGRRSRRYPLFSEIQIGLDSQLLDKKNALIIETSQTGFKIITTESFQTGDFIPILIMGNEKKINNTAEIIYCSKILDQKPPLNLIGIRLEGEFTTFD